MKLFKLFNILTIILLLALFVLPFAVHAQESPTEAELPAWALGLPTVLTGLVLLNFRFTEGFKRLLAKEGFIYTPSKEWQSILVMAFSIILGIGSAWVTPEATSWLGDYALSYPLFAVLLTGFSVSTLGGAVHEIFARLGGNGAIYKTTTEIKAPPESSSDKTAVASMDAVAQAAKS